MVFVFVAVLVILLKNVAALTWPDLTPAVMAYLQHSFDYNLMIASQGTFGELVQSDLL